MNLTDLKFDEKGLISVIVQHAQTQKVLMLGYMKQATIQLTLETKKVTFWSRSRNEIWQKGFTSGNFLNFVSMEIDCDQDALLIQALPDGPTCHTGSESCFEAWSEVESKINTQIDFSVLNTLISTIDQRFNEPKEGSYIQSLIEKGLPKIAQKVGEEGVEIVIEAMRNEPVLFNEEAADLLFHYLVLLRAKNVTFSEILEVLSKREKNKQPQYSL
jgi:phosphoribosyl-AMP cyclohydrolase / phosphoribosyl-ATP pyrophosphohydrolase